MTAVTMHHFSGLSAPFVRSKGTVSGGVFTDEVFDGSRWHCTYRKKSNGYIRWERAEQLD